MKIFSLRRTTSYLRKSGQRAAAWFRRTAASGYLPGMCDPHCLRCCRSSRYCFPLFSLIPVFVCVISCTISYHALQRISMSYEEKRHPMQARVAGMQESSMLIIQPMKTNFHWEQMWLEYIGYDEPRCLAVVKISIAHSTK